MVSDMLNMQWIRIQIFRGWTAISDGMRRSYKILNHGWKDWKKSTRGKSWCWQNMVRMPIWNIRLNISVMHWIGENLFIRKHSRLKRMNINGVLFRNILISLLLIYGICLILLCRCGVGVVYLLVTWKAWWLLTGKSRRILIIGIKPTGARSLYCIWRSAEMRIVSGNRPLWQFILILVLL